MRARVIREIVFHDSHARRFERGGLRAIWCFLNCVAGSVFRRRGAALGPFQPLWTIVNIAGAPAAGERRPLVHAWLAQTIKEMNAGQIAVLGQEPGKLASRKF